MRKIIGAAIMAAVLAGAAPAAAVPSARTEGCPAVRVHGDLLEKTFRYSLGGVGGDYRAMPVREENFGQLAAIRSCWKRVYRPAYRVTRKAWERESVAWKLYAHIDLITECGEWVLCGVVEHESATSGYYSAFNATGCGGAGCLGAYQIGQQHYSTSCAPVSAVRWEKWAQHQCAYWILHGGNGYAAEGPGAWAL